MSDTQMAIKKAKQYTVVGIKMGKFDDDLERLFKVIQRRRASIGQLRVLSINPNAMLSNEDPNTESNQTYAEGDYTPTYTWPMNQEHLKGEAVRVYDRIMNDTDNGGKSQPELTVLGAHNSARGTVGVGESYFYKDQLIGRIVAITDDYATDNGIAVAYVESIARRNLTCRVLSTSVLATNRKVNAVRAKARAQTVVIPPDAIADVYMHRSVDDIDPLRRLVDTGQTYVNINY